MAIAEGDFFIAVRGSDGEYVAFPVTPATSADDFIIPCITSDGEIVAMKVVAATTDGDLSIAMLTSDGEHVLMKTEELVGNLVMSGDFTNLGSNVVRLLGDLSAVDASTGSVRGVQLIDGLLVEVGGAVTGRVGFFDVDLDSWEPHGDRPGAVGTNIIASIRNAGGESFIGTNRAVAASHDPIQQWDGTDWQNTGGVSWDGSATLSCDVIRPWNDGSSDTVVIGGALKFTHVSGNTEGILIRKAGGGSWSVPGQIVGNVAALSQFGTDLAIGGRFTSVDGDTSLARLALWDGSAFSAIGVTSAGSPSTRVRGLCVHEGKLIIVGNFTKIDGADFLHIASWDGSTFEAIGGGLTAGTDIWTCLSANGKLYIGGDFSEMGGVTLNNAAVWNGSVWGKEWDDEPNGLVRNWNDITPPIVV